MTIEFDLEDKSAMVPINHDHPGDQALNDDEEIVLQPRQEKALEMMLLGKTDSEIANKLGVTRQTVNFWRKHDKAFKSVLCARQLDLWDGVRNEMSSIYTEALGVLRKNLKSKDPKLQLKAATQIVNLHELKNSLVNESNAYLKMIENMKRLDELFYWLQRNKKKKNPEEMTLEDLTYEMDGKEMGMRRRRR